MAKRNFKPQRPARKVKSKANLQKQNKVNKKANTQKKIKLKEEPRPKIKPEPEAGQSQWQLPPDYFDNLPPTHNAFIGYSNSDTIENVIAGIEVINDLANLDPQGLMLNPDSCFGLLWFTQNLGNALRFELKYRKLISQGTAE